MLGASGGGLLSESSRTKVPVRLGISHLPDFRARCDSGCVMATRSTRHIGDRHSVLALVSGLVAIWALAGAAGLATGIVELGTAVEERIPSTARCWPRSHWRWWSVYLRR